MKAKVEYGDGIIKETERIVKRGDAATNPLALPEPPQEPSIDPTTGTVTVSGSKQQKLAITAGPLHEKAPGEKRTDQQLIEAATPTDARGMYDNVKAMLPRRAPMIKKPTWHAPWKLYRCANLSVFFSNTLLVLFAELSVVTLVGCAASTLSPAMSGSPPVAATAS